jgi:predicted HTH transcriptional regulator
MKMLALLDLADSRGTGVLMMRRRARAGGFRPTRFRSTNGWCASIIQVDPETYIEQTPASSSKATPTKSENVAEKRERKTPGERDEEVLELIREMKITGSQELAEVLGVSRGTIRNSIERLQERNLVRGVGRPRSPQRRYEATL